MNQLETLATQANSVVVKVLRIHFTLECIACNSKGLEKARTWEKNNNRLNEVTGKEITQPRGVCVWGGRGGGEALPLIIPYRERPRLIKGVPFSDVIKRK